jgi:FAD-dependent urate hydroxylase
LPAIEKINALDRDAFVSQLGSLYEHSPWTADRAFIKRPFADEASLAAALADAVDKASEAEQLALIRAHPELAGDKLRAKALTHASFSEQAGAGLDRLSPTEIAEWARLNAAYRERFGFPFVICVRLHTKDEILSALNRRLTRTAAAEMAEAIKQIHDIARLRLTDLLSGLSASNHPPGLAALEHQVRRDLEMLADPATSWVRPRTHPSGVRTFDVIIVGGGQSGLGAAFALRRDGVSNVLVLDENPEGQEGPWITYARMITLRTPKQLTGVETGIPSLTFRAWYEALHGPAAWEALDKISREDWMDYLRWLRRTLNLPVRNGAKVDAISRETDGLFQLSIAGDPAPLFGRKVVLATGIQGGGEWHTPGFIRDTLPRHLYAHTSEAIDFSKLAGKRIGILGAGASSFDNAQHALTAGVAEAHVFVRREKLQRINPIRFMERTGLTKRYALLTDAEKYAALGHFLTLNQPPTNDTYRRAASHPGFRLHLGSPWQSARVEGEQVRITTPKGAHVFDFVVLSTGTATDLGLRPELAAFLDDIALWRDKVVPKGSRNPLIDAHPWLGPGFQLTGKTPESEARLHGLFLFNYAALASLGLSAAALSGLRYALPRLVEGVSGQLFLDDRQAILSDYFSYGEEEFTADRDET